MRNWHEAKCFPSKTYVVSKAFLEMLEVRGLVTYVKECPPKRKKKSG